LILDFRFWILDYVGVGNDPNMSVAWILDYVGVRNDVNMSVAWCFN
jgi:hypothetical protein